MKVVVKGSLQALLARNDFVGVQAFGNGSYQSRSPKISARILSMLSYFRMITQSRRYIESIFALLKQYDQAVTSINEHFLEMTESAILI